MGEQNRVNHNELDDESSRLLVLAHECSQRESRFWCHTAEPRPTSPLAERSAETPINQESTHTVKQPSHPHSLSGVGGFGLDGGLTPPPAPGPLRIPALLGGVLGADEPFEAPPPKAATRPPTSPPEAESCLAATA